MTALTTRLTTGILSTACSVIEWGRLSIPEHVETLPVGAVCAYDRDLKTLVSDGVEWVPVEAFDVADLCSASEHAEWLAFAAGDDARRAA